MVKPPAGERFDAQLFSAVHGRGFLTGLTLVIFVGLCLWVNSLYFHVQLFAIDGWLVTAVLLTWAYCFGVAMASLIWFALLTGQAAVRAFLTLISRKPPAGMFLAPGLLDRSTRRFAAAITLIVLALTLPLTIFFMAEIIQGRLIVSP